jgi:myo-inositol-1(or 4)-monophosphatase
VSGLEERLSAAADLADQAGEIALRWFRASPDVTNKAGEGAFDPVTAADHAVEEFLRDELTRRFPDDRFLGEETGESGGPGPFRWVIDPIDGTRAFISGNPLWGTLVGLEDGDRAVGGVVCIPYLGETFIGNGERAGMRRAGHQTAMKTRGAYLALWKDRPASHDAQEIPLQTSGAGSLNDAILCSTSPDMFAAGPERDAFDRLSAACRMTRYGGDCYSYCLLALGHVDLVVESGLQPYDIVALAPIIRATGGVVTTAGGGPAERGGFIVAAANATIHEQALQALRGG